MSLGGRSLMTSGVGPGRSVYAEHAGFLPSQAFNPLSGQNFQFGELLAQRQAMQQRLMEEQLRRMSEDRMRAREQDMQQRDLLRRQLKEQTLPRSAYKPQSVTESAEEYAGRTMGTAKGPARQWIRLPDGTTRELFVPESGTFAGGGGGSAAGGAPAKTKGQQIYEQNVAQSQSDFSSPLMQMQWMQAMGLAPQSVEPGGSAKTGGYIPKTGDYTLHKGEVVLNKDQSDVLFPYMQRDKSGRKSLQGGSVSLSPEDLEELYRRYYEKMLTPGVEMGAGEDFGGGGPSALERLYGSRGPGTAPNIPPMGPGEMEQVFRPDRPYELMRPLDRPGMRVPGQGAVREVGPAAKGASKLGKLGKYGLLGGAALGLGAIASQAGEGKGVLGGAAQGFYGTQAWLGYKLLELGFGQDVARRVATVVQGGAPTEARVNAALKKMGKDPVPPGALTEAPPSEASPAQGLQENYRIERKAGQPPKLIGRGEPETEGEKFQAKIDKLGSDAQKYRDQADSANAAADRLESYLFQRPHADNQGVKKMIAARRDEANRAMKRGDTASLEQNELQMGKMQLSTSLQSQYAKYRGSQLNNAFSAIDAAWKTAKQGSSDYGRDEFEAATLQMLTPYRAELAERYNQSPEEMEQVLRQRISAAWDDPQELEFIKMALRG